MTPEQRLIEAARKLLAIGGMHGDHFTSSAHRARELAMALAEIGGEGDE